MNILMCTNSTLIKIDETKIYTKNILYFMQTNFSAFKQYKNKITINYMTHEHFDRVFLLKWLYTLYSNITKNNFKDMKELLVKRIRKPIIIEFKYNIKEEKIIEEEKLVEKFTKKIDPYQDALDLLKVEIDDSKNIIKMKYKKLLKEYHPDNVYNKGELYIQEYTDKFKSIQNAYDLISA